MGRNIGESVLIPLCQGGSNGKEFACNSGDPASIPGLGQEDSLENRMVPTPVFLPGESHGLRSLAGYTPWGRGVRHD